MRHFLLVLALTATLLDSHAWAQAVTGRRTPWTTSRIQGTPDPPLPYVTEQVFADLELQQPTTLTCVPGTDRMIVTQLEREIVSFAPEDPATVSVALDLKRVHAEHFQTLGIAFDPGFPQAPWCYISYQLREHGDHGTRLSRFLVSDVETPRIDAESELLIATWRNHGHRGGCIEFGPDGYLYVPIGDGTAPSPPDALQTGQDLSDLQSSILRIDVEGATSERPYRVPPDNPFVNRENTRGEVWAYGFRNPWKICFHPITGELWTGDVGWEMMEMVYRVEKGGNYGWSVMEGSQPVYPDAPRGPTPIQPPIVEHSHVEARSVTGGYFYFGDRLPELRGAYIYGDYMTGKIWALRYENELSWHTEIADTPYQIISFALDKDNELLVVGFDGTVHRLAANPAASANEEFPRKLSETGLFSSTSEHVPAPGVLPYSIRAEHWADHTVADRLLAVPGFAQLDVYDKDNAQVGQNKGHVEFPADSVLAKTVSLEMIAGDPTSRRRLETQVLHRRGDAWQAYNYVWTDDQSDAILQPNLGESRVFDVQDREAPGGKRRQVWHYSSRDECLLCHIWRAGTVHGFKLEQLNHDGSGNLQELAAAGVFAKPLPQTVGQQASPYDVTESLDSRARAYLHLNCAHCHRRGGGGTAAIDVQQHLPLPKTDIINAPVTQGHFGIHEPRIVAPGDPYRSVLYYRLAKLGRGHMPQFGTSLVDTAGLQLIHDWIDSMPTDVSTVFHRRKILEQLTEASNEDVQGGIKQLLSSTSGALLVASAINDALLPEAQARVAVELASKHADPEVRDLFERFLPPDRRVPRLGDVVDPATVLTLRGDVARGEKIYLNGSGVACKNCHLVRGNGGRIGPALDKLDKKYSPAEILESILAPSRKIEAKYQTYLLETSNGQLATGLLVTQSEEAIVLRDATGRDRRFNRSEVELFEPQRRSLMPENLLRDFTAQQAADLLAFLNSLMN